MENVHVLLSHGMEAGPVNLEVIVVVILASRTRGLGKPKFLISYQTRSIFFCLDSVVLGSIPNFTRVFVVITSLFTFI